MAQEIREGLSDLYRRCSDFLGVLLLNLFDVLDSTDTGGKTTDNSAQEMFLKAFNYRLLSYSIISFLFLDLMLILDLTQRGTTSNQLYGLSLDLLGAIVLGRGLVKGRYSITEESSSKVSYNLSIRESLAKDSVDGSLGILLILIGVFWQFIAVSTFDQYLSIPYNHTYADLKIEFVLAAIAILLLYSLKKTRRTVKWCKRGLSNFLRPQLTDRTYPIDSVSSTYSGWPMFRYDCSKVGATTSKGPRENMAVNWKIEIGRSYHSPVIDTGRLFVYGDKNELSAFDLESNSLAWGPREFSGNSVSSPAAVQLCHPETTEHSDDGYLYFTAEEDSGTFIYCLRASTGIFVWKKKIGRGCSPTVNDGIVYVSSSNYLYAFNALHGTELWKREASHTHSPAVSDNFICVRGSDHDLLCFNPNTGEEKWSQNLDKIDQLTSIAIKNGMIFAGSRSYQTPEQGGIIYCLDGTDGSLIWKFDDANRLITDPIVTTNHLYLGDWTADSGKLYCLRVS